MRIDWSRRFNTIAFLCEKEGFWWYTRHAYCLTGASPELALIAGIT